MGYLIAVGSLWSLLALPGLQTPPTAGCESAVPQQTQPSLAPPSAEEVAQALKENEDALAALQKVQKQLEASHRKLEELVRRQAARPPAPQPPIYPYPPYPYPYPYPAPVGRPPASQPPIYPLPGGQPTPY